MKAIEEYTILLSSIDPLIPEDQNHQLTELAIQLLIKSQELKARFHPITYAALISAFECLEVDAFIKLLSKKNAYVIDQSFKDAIHSSFQWIRSQNQNHNPYSKEFLIDLHEKYIESIKLEHRSIVTENGYSRNIIPKQIRHSGYQSLESNIIHFSRINQFLDRLNEKYIERNTSRTSRIYSIPAAFHRLKMIKPFMDANEEMELFFLFAAFQKEGIYLNAIWSIYEPILRNIDVYEHKKINAFRNRIDENDGLGMLSNKHTYEFCHFMLKIFLDEIENKLVLFDQDKIQTRIIEFTKINTIKNGLREDAQHILLELFTKGKLSKVDAMRICNCSDKTLKLSTDQLQSLNLLELGKQGREIYFYPKYSSEFLNYIINN